MTIKSAGSLKLSEIENEFDIYADNKNIKLSALADDADVDAPYQFSEFYTLKNGPREIFSNFTITAGQKTHTLEWSVIRDDGADPSGNVYIYAKEGTSVEINDDNLLTPNGLALSISTYSHTGGYNKQWAYALVLRNTRGQLDSAARVVSAIPTVPKFERDLELIRDPDGLGTDAGYKTVSIRWDLEDTIDYSEGYSVEILFKPNVNQDFNMIDTTISRDSAVNGAAPQTVTFAAGIVNLNKTKEVKIDGHQFELFVRYTVMIYLKWTNQEITARGVLDFAGEEPAIPLVMTVPTSNAIQVSWVHDNKSSKYELYYSPNEFNTPAGGSLLQTFTESDSKITTAYTHNIGFNKVGWYLVKASTQFASEISAPKYGQTIETTPTFENALIVKRDPNNLNTDSGNKLVSVSFDLANDIPMTEGYTVSLYYKANDNQTFAQVDGTISKTVAVNSGNPFTKSFSGSASPTDSKTIDLTGITFELFTRYTIMLVLDWDGVEIIQAGLVDFAGKVPDKPILGFTVGPNTIQISWTHDNKSTKYELYTHTSEENVVGSGTLLYTATPNDSGVFITTHTHNIGYNKNAWYVVKAYTQFSNMLSDPKNSSTSTSQPVLDGSLSIIRDPDFEGYDKQTLVQAEWDLKDDGPDYSEGYDVEFYYRAQESAFADSSMTRQNADNASAPIKGSFSGFAPQKLKLTGVTFEHLTRYTVLMVLKWTGQEVSSRAFLEMAGKIPDPARGLSVFVEGNKSLKVSWTDDEKTDTYKLYGSNSSGGNLSTDGGSLLKTFTGNSASYEYTESLDYSTTRFYQVISINEYAADGILSGVRSGSTMEPALSVSCQAVRSGTSMTDVQMTWTVGPADLSGYSISIKIGESEQSGFSGTSKSHTFTNAAPDINSTYKVDITLSWGSKSPATSSSTVPIYSPLSLPIPTGLAYDGNIVSWSLSNNGNTNVVTDYRIRATVYNLGDPEPDLGTSVANWTSNSSATNYRAGVISRQFMKWATCAYAGTVNGLSGSSSPIATKIFAQGKPDSISIENTYSSKNTVNGTLKFSNTSTVTGWVISYTSNSSGSGVVKSGTAPTSDEPFQITGLQPNDTINIEARAYWYQDNAKYSQVATKSINTLSDYGVTMGKPLLALDDDSLQITIPNLTFTVSGGEGSYQLEFGISGCTYQSYTVGEAGSFLGRTGTLVVDVPKTLTLRFGPSTVLNKLQYTNSYLPHGATISVRVTVVHPTGNATAQSSAENLTMTGDLGHKFNIYQEDYWGPSAVYGDSSMKYYNGAGGFSVVGSRVNTVQSNVDKPRTNLCVQLKTQSGSLLHIPSTANITNMKGNFLMDGHTGTDTNVEVTPYIQGNLYYNYDSARTYRFRNVDEASITGSIQIVEGPSVLFKPMTISCNLRKKIPRQAPSPRYRETVSWNGSTITIDRKLRYSVLQGTTIEDGLRPSSAWKTASTVTVTAFYQVNGGATQSKVCSVSKSGNYEYIRLSVSGITDNLVLLRYEIDIHLDGGYTRTTIHANYNEWMNSNW